MIADALLAYLHFGSILFLTAVLGAEYYLLRAQPGPAIIGALARADTGYGIASVVVIVTGVLRALYGVKGWAFYTGNPVFWVKIALFIAVGLVSIKPTIRFIQWRKALRADHGFIPPAAEIASMKRVVLIELHLLALIPLAAVFMARGMGF